MNRNSRPTLRRNLHVTSPLTTPPASPIYVPFQGSKKNFVMPTLLQQVQACGLNGDRTDCLFRPTSSFQTIAIPKPGYWLAEQTTEKPQTYRSYLRSNYRRFTKSHRKLYLLPLGSFSTVDAPPLGGLAEFARAFFPGMQVVLLPCALVKNREVTQKKMRTYERWYFNLSNRVPVTTRKHQALQLLTSDIHKLLVANLPKDAYCLLAVTMYDLYPQESWNYVFGEASLREGVGVFSFARYTPGFGTETKKGEPGETSSKESLNTSNQSSKVLYRSLQVMAHEVCHMFNIRHCLYFQCLMNGSNCLEESDEQPLFLCPVDLRKLCAVLQFDVKKRYEGLLAFCQKFNGQGYSFEKEITWLKNRLCELSSIDRAKRFLDSEELEQKEKEKSKREHQRISTEKV